MSSVSVDAKKRTNRRMQLIILAICCAAVLAAIAYVVMTRGASKPIDSNTLTAIPGEVKINGSDVVYTADHPMIIMEIVPDKALGELGYLVGGDSEPVLLEDVNKVIARLKEQGRDTEARQLFLSYIGPIRGYTNCSESDIDMNNGSIKKYEDRNILANAICGNSNMSDKLKVVTVAANQLTLRTVTDEKGNSSQVFYDAGTKQTYDPAMIYIHSSEHLTGGEGGYAASTVYNLMADYTDPSSSKCLMGITTTNTYVHTPSNIAVALEGKSNFIQKDANGKSYNLRGDVSYEIYLRTLNMTGYKKTALIMDRNTGADLTGVSGDGNSVAVQEGDNVSKLTILTMSITGEQFQKLFVSTTGIPFSGDTVKRDLTDTASNLTTVKQITTTGHFEDDKLDVTGTVTAGETDWTVHIEATQKKNSESVSLGETTSTNLIWSNNMFWVSVLHNGNQIYPYAVASSFQGDNGACIGQHFLNNSTYVFGGDKEMTQSMLWGAYSDSDRKNTDGKTMTAFDELKGKLETTDYMMPDVLQFILGGKSSQYISPGSLIHVLEITPAGQSKYTGGTAQENADHVKELMRYFSDQNYDEVITASNYDTYMEIKSIASNGFIGLTEDIESVYDLIVITDYDTISKNKGYINQAYYSIGERLKFKDMTASLSGNDFTEKAMDKIYTYIDSGKPLIIADSIYNGAQIGNRTIYNLTGSGRGNFTTSLKTNIYDLAKTILEKEHSVRNVVAERKEGETITSALAKKYAPDVTIDNRFKCTYDNNGLISSTSGLEDLESAFTFTGTVGTTAGYTCNLKVFFDKNGDGLYVDNENESEVYFDGKITTKENGSFAVPIILPDDLKGYIRIKAVVKTAAGVSSQDEGAIVLQYDESEKTTVNVLQILPNDKDTIKGNDGTTLHMGNNKSYSTNFFDSFKAASGVTGIYLNVTEIHLKDVDATVDDLSQYGMVVIGFTDNFGGKTHDLSDKAVKKITEYANSGKPVLMAHDGVMYSAYGNEYGTGTTDDTAPKASIGFRNLVGMDRYGVMSSLNTGTLRRPNMTYQYKEGFSNAIIMRFGTANGSALGSYRMYEGQKQEVDSNIFKTDTVNKLNSGQITEYPYQIPEDLKVAYTHSQYYQLDLEKKTNSSDEVVVWYTLGASKFTKNNSGNVSGNDYFGLAGQDALNNYYIYSKGNITYSGAGHSDMNNQTDEIKLFVNTVFKALKSGNQAPVVDVTSAAYLKSVTSETYVTTRIYDQFVRDFAEDSEYKEVTIQFTPHDADMGVSKTPRFDTTRIYWDVDGDGAYDSKKDVEITDMIYEDVDQDGMFNLTVDKVARREYGTEWLHNMTHYAIAINMNNEKYTKNGVKLWDAVNNGTARINIEVRDAKIAGIAQVNLSYRTLFNLE